MNNTKIPLFETRYEDRGQDIDAYTYYSLARSVLDKYNLSETWSPLTIQLELGRRTGKTTALMFLAKTLINKFDENLILVVDDKNRAHILKHQLLDAGIPKDRISDKLRNNYISSITILTSRDILTSSKLEEQLIGIKYKQPIICMDEVCCASTIYHKINTTFSARLGGGFKNLLSFSFGGS